MMFFPEIDQFFDLYLDNWAAKPERKMVVLLRGLPGCGKSSFAEQLVERAANSYMESVVCSTDDYFINEQGDYHFEPRDLSTNHAKCYAKYQRHLMASPGQLDFVKLIIVDNTNIRRDEMERYTSAVYHMYDCRYHSFRFKCRSEEEAATQCLRSTHCVPLSVVLGRYEEYTYRIDRYDETEVNPKYEDRDAYRLEKRIADFE